ncbi:MAG: DUF192 domain-containing protein [Pseudomonadota bacterium]
MNSSETFASLRRAVHVAALSSLILCLWSGLARAQSPEPQRLPSEIVTIETAAGEIHVFAAEIADDADERAKGLMFRQDLGVDEGMLFIYERPGRVGFWMRNTLIPLDMIFVAPGGRIVHIHENAIPGDETGISSQGVVRSVLEIRGGLSRRLGLAVGDYLSSPALTPYGD